MDHESTYKPGSRAAKWWDERLPVMRLMHGQFVDFPTPRNLNYAENDGDSDNITPLVIAQRWPVKTWTSLAERALHHAALAHAVAAAPPLAVLDAAVHAKRSSLETSTGRAKLGQACPFRTGACAPHHLD